MASPFGPFPAESLLLFPRFLPRCVFSLRLLYDLLTLCLLGFVFPLPPEYRGMHHLQEHWPASSMQFVCCEEVSL